LYGFWVLAYSEFIFGWSKTEKTPEKSKKGKPEQPKKTPQPKAEQPAQPEWVQAPGKPVENVPTAPVAPIQPAPKAPEKPTWATQTPSAPEPFLKTEATEVSRRDVWSKTAIFGDSITVGYGDILMSSKSWLKTENFSAKIGIWSRAILDNIKTYLARNPKPNLKYAVLMMWANNPGDVAMTHIDEAKSLLSNAWVKVVVWTYACEREDIKAFNNYIRSHFSWEDVLDIELAMRWWNLNNPLGKWVWEPDRVHLTNSGYKKQAEIIENYLKSREWATQTSQTPKASKAPKVPTAADQQILDIANWI